MINSNLFFNKFQINYFDYKVSSLKYILENIEKVELDKLIVEYDENDFKTSIRSEIRQTVFQSIETVFEILFALLPEKKGVPTNDIIKKITLSSLPYERIKEIAESDCALNFLDKELNFNNNSTSTIGEYIFYHGFQTKIEYKENIKESFITIRKGLKILAKEFSDRREYNSYKHGMRIIPAFSKFSLKDIENNNKEISWSLKDSMTFYTFDKKTSETKYITKVFDTNRDIRIVSFCSFLLWNMIKLRDYIYNKTKYTEKKEFTIFFFDDRSIDNLMKRNVETKDLVYTVKHIYK